MRNPGSLLAELAELKKSDEDPHRRGIRFQELIAAAFRRGHFIVERGATPAKPRQTDVFAVSGSARYLIEVKWRRTRSHVGDVAEVQNRLRRMQSGVVGVLVSATGFADTAVAEGHRESPVLLVDLADLENVLAGYRELAVLLEEKHDELLVRASARMPPKNPRRTATESLIASDVTILRDGNPIPWIPADGEFGQFVFTRALRDIDWVTGSGFGVGLDLSPEIRDERNLVDALRRLAQHGWVTSAGHWNLQQATRNWHGMGTSTLAQALTGRKQRYDGLDQIHHTEVLCYTDECEDGFFTIRADIAADNRGTIWRVDVSLQLSGVPFDDQPLRALRHALGVTSRAFFRPRREKSVRVIHLREQDQPDLHVHALLVQPDLSQPSEEWVSGIVVENPLRGRRQFAPGNVPEQLFETNLLLCSLGSWHPLAWPKQRYHLRRIERGCPRRR